jgi:acyl-CoA thioesterase-1
MTSLARDVAFCGALALLAVPGSTVGLRAGDTRPSPPLREPGGQIVVLADSLAVSPSRTENFVATLQRRLVDAGQPWTMVNAGVRGDTTANGLRRLERVLTPETRILIVELGANDGLRGVDTKTIERNLSEIIARAQARGIRVLLCGMMVPPRDGWRYAVAFFELFPRLASQYNVPLVPFILQGVALNPEMNGPDGIHPNKAGAERIADTVWPHLESLFEPA